MVPSGIKIGKEQLNTLAYADGIALIEKNEIEIRKLRVRPRNRSQDGVREDGRVVGGEGWQERVHNREE